MNTSPYSVNDADRGDFREGVTIQPINAALVADQMKSYQKSILKQLPEVLDADIDNYEYRIAARDILKVTVWDHPELTSPAGVSLNAAGSGNLVRKDGTIFYPYVGVLPVAGKTVEEVRQALSDGLSSYIENPQLDITVSSYRSQLVYVTGQVTTSGFLPITDQPLTVVDAIAQSGGYTATADIQHATLTRDGVSYNIDLFSLYERGYSQLNVLLKAGDVLNIPNNELNKVFVLGEVSKPATLFVNNGQLTLAEAISDTNGFGASSNPGQVYVIRGKRSQVNEAHLADRYQQLASLEIYHLDATSPDALFVADQFRLQARDVVYVSPTALGRFSRVFAQVGSIINTTAQTVILQRTLAP
ncbi:MAG: polysaccharide biosynthesis/export family protein [Ghiorsea sp.]|nr:polysaccharide biosynthesis/export family protein [Ghiorsea sp.]